MNQRPLQPFNPASVAKGSRGVAPSQDRFRNPRPVRLVLAAGLLTALLGPVVQAVPLTGSGLQDPAPRQPGWLEFSDGVTARPEDSPQVTAANADRLMNRMKDDLRAGRLGAVGPTASAVLKVQPDNADALMLHALHLAASGQIDQARREFLAGTKGSPDAQVGGFAESMLLLKEQELAKAEVVCRRVIEKDPGHPYGWNILGRIQLANGRQDDALASFAEAVKLNPAFTPGLVNLGAVNLAKGDPKAAAGYFLSAKRVDPNDEGCCYGLALAEDACGNPAAAIRALEDALKLSPGHGPSLTLLGQLQMKAGDHANAVRTGRRMVAANVVGAREFAADALLHTGDVAGALAQLDAEPGDSPHAMLLRANAAIVGQDYQGALKTLDQLLTSNPYHFGGVVTRATIHLVLGKASGILDADLDRWGDEPRRLLRFVQGAERGMAGNWKGAFEAMADGAPVLQGFSFSGLSAEILAEAEKAADLPHLALGLLLSVQDLKVPAMARFTAALASNENSVLANFLQGAALLESADLKAAEKHFLRSLAKAPRFFPCLYALGDLYMRMRQVEPALEYLQRANAVVPTSGIDMRMGIIYENTNRFEQAEACYQSFIKASPEAFIGYNQLAWLYASQGRKLDEALRLATKADSMQPGNASVLDTIGWVHFQQGKLAEAVASLLASVRVNPANPTVCYHLGAAYAGQGNREKAREFLRRALELSKEFPEIKQTEQLLDQLK